MSSATRLVLDDDQKFALMRLRRNMHDVLQPHHCDVYLMRWLKARNWSVEGAEKMLRQSLKWRAQWEVDAALSSWSPPEVVQRFYPYGISGVDKDGAPVTFAGLDLLGLLHSASRQDLIRTTIQILERVVAIAAQSGIHGLCVICDMDDFSLRQYTWRPAAQYVIALLQMYEANYPEILKACFIINAPRVFAIAFNVVKTVLNENTLAKIQIFKREPSKWQHAILANIAPDQLPRHYGGLLEDADGNPRFTTKINVGGKVPKAYYTKKLPVPEEGDRERASAVIKKGGQLVLDFPVTEEHCFLRWDFRTEGHDIRFGITLKDAQGETSAAVRFGRVASHQLDESGVLACQAPATYTVTFDNSYSLLRSKRLHYSVYLTEPLNKIEILPREQAGEAGDPRETA
ncbi:hypothetical protein D910_06901 [Dendroctonus ponderosae]|uniref:CRAL-TRIO domain-containing protein n=1 Tax=Dendroctonus ponderosae TaxID=77166 RepID=U4UI26_DENPD|nr:hypothetical protein D910_06901 [Dendroctonus ponderosae]